MSRIVLVHGAMGNATVWPEAFVQGLESRGHTVEAIDLPAQGNDTTPKEVVTMQLYADKVVEQLASRPEPAVLIGHSMGGVVVTQAADDFVANGGELDQVIYLTAFLPRNGQSLMMLTGMPEGEGDAVQANLVVSGEPPMGTFPAEAAQGALFNETPIEMLMTMPQSAVESQPIIPFTNPVSITDDRDITRRYIFATNDRAIPLPLQKKMAMATKVDAVAALDSDHMPFYSRQEQLIEIIDQFTKE